MNATHAQFLASYFSVKIRDLVDTKTVDQMIKISSNQLEIWKKILDFLEETFHVIPSGQNVLPVLQFIKKGLNPRPDQMLNEKFRDLYSEIPAIEQQDRIYDVISKSPEMVAAAIEVEIIPIFNRITHTIYKDYPATDYSEYKEVEIAREFYISAKYYFLINKNQINNRNNTEKNFENWAENFKLSMKEKFEELAITLQSQAKLFEADVIRRQSENEKLNLNMEKAMSSFEENADNAIKKSEENWSTKIENYLKAQKELSDIGRPVALWKAAESKHITRFYVGLFGLFLIGAISVIAVVNYLEPTLTHFHFLSDGKLESFTPGTTLALATIVALITAAGFLLRIAGRLVTNSLTLAEDASVRAALADTFISLTAHEEHMDKQTIDQARTIMLAALFRPLPGHQQEELQTPSVISLAQDMLKGGPTKN